MSYCLINQKLVKSTEAKISIEERGFRFGDGIFETCKIFAGKIYNYQAHENRIKDGLKALKFNAEIDNIKQRAQKLIQKNKIKNGILRISITRGIGSQGYLPTYQSEALIVMQTFPEPKITNQKIRIGISKIQKPSAKSMPSNCKTIQSLSSILSKITAQENGWFDAIMLNEKNFISEASSANIFWVKNNKIYTPNNKCDCVAGTIRQRLLSISPFKIYQCQKTISALKTADEIFLTNSAFLIIAVDEFDDSKKIKKLSKNFAPKLLEIIQQDVGISRKS